MNRGSKKGRPGFAWWMKIFVVSVVMLSLWIPEAKGVLATTPNQPIVVDSFFDFGADINPGDGECKDNFGKCTLRAAIMEANAMPGMDTIVLPPGEYTLMLAGPRDNESKSGDLDILDDIKIIGANGDQEGDPTKTVIDGGGIDRVFSINPYWNKPISATFQALTITNGKNHDTGIDPTNNRDGGALDFEASGSGTLLIYNCIISNNETINGGGGGLSLINTGPLSGAKARIEKSMIRNNSSYGRGGGGIYVEGQLPVEIVSSTITENTVQSSGTAYGGGIYFNGAETSFISNSAISYNKALGSTNYGGGVFLASPITITDSTISNNLTNTIGGGIRSSLGTGKTAKLVNVTVTQNTAKFGGSGISTDDNTLEVHNSLIAGNTGTDMVDIVGLLQGISSYNLIGISGTGGLLDKVNGNQVGVSNPGIGPLADNGGPTQTHALLPGSPALDKGTNSKASSTDQRGMNRMVDATGADQIATVDIGAFEAQVSVEDIGNYTMFSNSSLSIPFTIGEAPSIAGTSSVVASSTNTALVPNASANLEVLPGDSASTRTLKITPVNGQVGTTNISVTIDGGSAGSMTDTFVLTVVPAPVPDLTVALNTASLYRGKTGATYDITVKNTGTAPTSGTVTVTAELPAGLSATAISGNGWTCDKNTLICTRSDALSAGNTYPLITLTFDVAANAPSNVTTSVSVTGSEESNSTNKRSSRTETVFDPHDLTITKSHTGDFYKGQKEATYSITVKNVGGLPTLGAGNPQGVDPTVTVKEYLPDGLILKSMNGTGWNCVTANSVCTRSDILAPGAAYPVITVTVDVASDAPAQLTNIATVSGGGELNTDNNSASDVTEIKKLVDLNITKTHTGTFRQGQTGATYTVMVTNNGIGATNGQVTVTEELPTGLTLTGLQGTGWTCDVVTSTCLRSDPLGKGASYDPITVTVNVAENAPVSLTNKVTVSGGGDLDPGEKTATDPTDIDQLADLTIAKTHTGSFTQGEKGRTYTIIVSNQGSAPTVGEVTVTDLLPDGLILTGLQGNGWSCDKGTGICRRSDQLNPGTSYEQITVTVDVAANAPLNLTNTATVSGGDDRNTGNNTATDSTTIIPIADLTIAKSHAGYFSQGQSGGTYILTVTNVGSAPTVGEVTVTELLPNGLTLTGLSGTGWTCNIATSTCKRSDQLNEGNSYDPITVTVDVAANAPASLTNTATVSGGGELNTSNNQASDTNTIIQLPDLAISVSHSGKFRQGQTGATYTINVSNMGSAATAGTVIATFVTPTGLTLTGLSGDGWNCTPSIGGCTRYDSLPAGASYDPITATVDVAIDAPSRVTSSATILGDVDANPENDTASDVTMISLPLSTNANLSSLTLSGTKLDQPFDQNQTVYTAKTAYNVSRITVTPTPVDSNATITVNGSPVKNGKASTPIDLKVGSNPVTIVVTAEDDLTTKDYFLTIERAATGPSVPPYIPPTVYPVEKVELDRTSLDLIAGGQTAMLSTSIQPANATEQRVTWSSSDEGVARVNQNGMVTPVAPGTATITVTTLDQGKTATCLVTVKELPISGLEVDQQGIWLKPNRTKSIRVYAIQDDGERREITKDKETRYSIESKGSKNVATISASGVVRGKSEGEAVITIDYKEKTITIPVTVSKASVSTINVTENDLTMEAGDSVQLGVTATLSNKQTKDVTSFAEWAVEDNEIAIVQSGKVTAIAPGTTLVTALFEGKEVEVPVEVTEAKQIKRLRLSKPKATVKIEKTITIRLTAYYQDGAKRQVTEKAEWMSNDDSIATVEAGKIKAKAKGTTTIIAKYQGKSIRFDLTIIE